MVDGILKDLDGGLAKAIEAFKKVKQLSQPGGAPAGDTAPNP